MRYNDLVGCGQVSWAAFSMDLPQSGQAANSPNPFRIRTSVKYPRNSFRIRTSKSKGLKVFYNQHLQKTPGAGVGLSASRLEGGPQV